MIMSAVFLLGSTYALAGTEVICDNGKSDNPSSGTAINARIAELEKQGKAVTITNLVSSLGGAGAGESKYGNTNLAIMDKVCVAIKY